MVTSIATIIGVLVMMFTISWIMALVALIIVPVSMMLIMMIVRRSQKYFRKQQDYLGHINGHVEEMYSGHNVMKAFNGEEKSIRKFDGLNEELYGAAWKAQFFSGIMMPMMMFIGNLGYVVMCILGGYSGNTEDDSGGRYTGLYPVHPVIYAAAVAGSQYGQHSAIHRRCGRACI